MKKKRGQRVNELALFSGAGGGILGSYLLGWKTICAVEINAYARSVLLARQNDRTLAPFPIWDDIKTFDGKPWRGIVDVVSGGFPCQDISIAGTGKGLSGERSGLWKEMARIIREVRPRYAYMENSPALTSRGLDTVLADLAALGFDAEWGVLGAYQVGAPHKRERIWIVANASCKRCGLKKKEVCTRRDSVEFCSENVANTNHLRKLQLSRRKQEQWDGISNSGKEISNSACSRSQIRIAESLEEKGNKKPKRFYCNARKEWPAEPRVGRVVNGLAHRVDRLKALGNGQVPRVAATAFGLLINREI